MTCNTDSSQLTVDNLRRIRDELIEHSNDAVTDIHRSYMLGMCQQILARELRVHHATWFTPLTPEYLRSLAGDEPNHKERKEELDRRINNTLAECNERLPKYDPR